jgi:hypothetical protein
MSSHLSFPWRGVLAAVTLSGVFASPSLAVGQQAVPVRELSPADAKTTQLFGNIFGVRQLAGGKVLVNDGVRHQLVVVDDKLSNPTVVIDSVAEGGQSYGPRAAPLIPYLADSTLFVDGTSLSLLVIDPMGKIAHVMSAPKSGDLRFMAGSPSYTDEKGNLMYRGALQVSARANGPPTPGGAMPAITIPDSSPVVRANFDTRQIDTVGRVKIQSGTRTSMTQDGNGKLQLKMTINPLTTVDDWAVYSDGTIAFVRGHDYHLDLIQPDGKAVSAPKMPFDWKRLSDEDKQALIDSAQKAMDTASADAKANAANPAAAARAGAEAAMTSIMGAMGGGGGGGGMNVEVRIGGPPGSGGDHGGGGAPMVFGGDMGRVGGPGMGMPVPTVEFVPLKDIADYYPAIRPNAVKADLDGNLWILTTTSAQSKAGELVYDVVDHKGTLTQRVRIPLGRSIAGFGHNGIVYLMYKAGTAGWALERTKVMGYTRATD